MRDHRHGACWRGALAGWLGLLLSEGAGAQTLPSATFQVAATVSQGCLVNHRLPSQGAAVGRIGRLDFGIDSALSQATRETTLVRAGDVTLSCTPGIALSLRVGAGQHALDGSRRLRHQGQARFLAYRLYRDASFQTPIGIDQDVAVNTGSGADNVQFPIRARLTLPGSLPAGDYTDELILTLTW